MNDEINKKENLNEIPKVRPGEEIFERALPVKDIPKALIPQEPVAEKTPPPPPPPPPPINDNNSGTE